ncbi:GNAT family acetyltransferase [Ornithinimicrobium murale]|uniref:GNAT family acetyltransferase n=1 Tax=Ornithinimicrobium murale TaxID=1050153 RepID=UPI000E0DC0DA|nr:GNAT family acetyltransferase [Ornithinimicrobium murale]
MDLRELLADEADRAVALWEECGLTRPWNDPRADLFRALSGETSTVLAAAEAGQLVGTAMVGHDGHRGWVYYLAVSPEHRRSGVGRGLMTACERWLNDHGAPKVQLMVRQGNTSVVAFYQALGYTDQETLVLGRFLDPELERRRRAGAGGHD